MAKKKSNTELNDAIQESEMLIEKYEYKGEGELMVDRPSVPLEEIKQEIIPIKVIEKQPEPVSNKNTFNKLILTKSPFILKHNNVIIFDSQKDRILDISFQDEYFIVKNKSYVYGGLSFKNKK